MVNPHYVVRLLPWTWWLLLPCSICLVDVWQWIDKLSTCITGLDPPLLGLRVATDVPKAHNFGLVRPHYVVRLFPWTWWLLLPCSICLVGVCEWIGKLSTWSKCIGPRFLGFIAAMNVPKISQFQHPAPTLCCTALPMDLMIAAAMFHLPCGCMWMDWQAFYMI